MLKFKVDEKVPAEAAALISTANAQRCFNPQSTVCQQAALG
jgi:hypothetical protein